MENKNIMTSIVILLLGLGIGYFAGTHAVGQKMSTIYTPPHNMHGAMQGMMGGLEGKSGDALDQAFIDQMIIHHEGAVEMAQILLKSTKRPELIRLGNDIISAQTGEIQTMKRWRTEWFGQ